ncbi:MAG: cobalt-precorrin-6A reductase [Pseudomonadota bacterium]
MTLLLLAGTREAQQIARALSDQGRDVVASLAGVTRAPINLGIETRRGGFGGEDGFRDEIRHRGITAVLDATHPFAHRISNRTARICAQMNLPYCQLLRPAWEPEAGDQWTQVAGEDQVAALVTPGQTVFLATGRQTLDRFANLSHARIICRQIDPPEGPFPFPNGEFLIGRPPFPVEREVELFQSLGVDWLVVKNAGGEASKTKLTAARQLGIDVAMITRPPQPDGDKAVSVQDALQWVAAL